jgi:hypothetical protein
MKPGLFTISEQRLLRDEKTHAPISQIYRKQGFFWDVMMRRGANGCRRFE